MAGFDQADPRPVISGSGGVAFPRGHILHDYLESRVMPVISGPVGRGNLQYAAIWKTAQRLTARPVKFGTVTAEVLAVSVRDRHYKSVRERILAIAEALNAELQELADAGCPVIQIEEPQIHLIAVRGAADDVLNPGFFVEVFNTTVRGLRAKTEVWCHTCWGNPSQQRMFAKVQSYEPAPCVLQDRRAGAGHQHRAAREEAPRGRMPRCRCALYADRDGVGPHPSRRGAARRSSG
jgi:5-methyltetrahydropteroyltriglutamate--homocysteine methyltransferase